MTKMKAMACLAMGIAGCSAADTGTGGVSPVVVSDPVATPAAVQGTHGTIISYFDGSFDPVHGMTITYRAPAGGLTPENVPIPASGSGPTITTITMHTVPLSEGFGTPGGCNANSLCGEVEAVNGLSVPGTFYAYIDETIPSGMTGGPWQYDNIANATTSAPQMWNILDTSLTPFEFIGHVEAVFQNCSVLHAQLPGVGTGVTEINPGGSTIPAYCDMTTAGGGWTQVYDQNVNYPSSQAGYSSNWLTGVSTTAPNGGYYSILNVLSASGATMKKATEYEFLFNWGPSGSLQWLQNENPLAISNPTSPTGLSVLAQSPAGLAQTGTACGSFSGLYTSAGLGQAMLDGDNSHSCWYFAVGEKSSWTGSNSVVGIPSYSNNGNPGVSEVKLYVR